MIFVKVGRWVTIVRYGVPTTSHRVMRVTNRIIYLDDGSRWSHYGVPHGTSSVLAAMWPVRIRVQLA